MQFERKFEINDLAWPVPRDTHPPFQLSGLQCAALLADWLTLYLAFRGSYRFTSYGSSGPNALRMPLSVVCSFIVCWNMAIGGHE